MPIVTGMAVMASTIWSVSSMNTGEAMIGPGVFRRA